MSSCVPAPTGPTPLSNLEKENSNSNSSIAPTNSTPQSQSTTPTIINSEDPLLNTDAGNTAPSFESISEGTIEEEIIDNEILPFDFSNLYPQYQIDGQGFTPWRIGRLPSTNLTDGYANGNLWRCLNNSTRLLRECFVPGQTGQCLGVIEKEVSCSSLGMKIPKYSAWTKFKSAGNCINGQRLYTRQCISLDQETPKCFGPTQINISCSSASQETSKINQLTEKFNKTTECQPDSSANNFYATLCGGIKMAYNGVREKYSNCFINETGQIICPSAPTLTYCHLPATACSMPPSGQSSCSAQSQAPANIVQGTQYLNVNNCPCGVVKGSASDPDRQYGFSNWNQGQSGITSILGEVQNCGVGQHSISKRNCIKQKSLPACLMTIDQVQTGSQKDQTCLGDVSKIVNCQFSSSYANLNRNGIWTEWKTITGCHFNSHLNRFVKIQERVCESTRRAGNYCDGEKVRYLTCDSAYDGVSGYLIIDSQLASNQTLMTKIEEYKNLIISKGADLNIKVVNSAALNMQGLLEIINNLQSSNGKRVELISLIGSFPYSRLNLSSEMRFSSNDVQTVSDLPLMVENSSAFNLSNGVFTFKEEFKETSMKFSRVIFRTDFTNSIITRNGVSNATEKYLHYFNKLILTHQSGVLNFGTGKKTNVLSLIDEDWDHSAFIEEDSNSVQSSGNFGDNSTRRGGFEELFQLKAAHGVLMAHGSGNQIGFTTYSNLPSNGHPVDISKPNSLLTNVSSEDIFNSLSFQQTSFTLFNCHSLNPDIPNNIGTSLLLGVNSKVVSIIGAYGSGSMHQWSSLEFTRPFFSGDSMGQAILKWSQNQKFGTSQFQRIGTTAYANTLKWHSVLALAGDPFIKSIER